MLSQSLRNTRSPVSSFGNCLNPWLMVFCSSFESGVSFVLLEPTRAQECYFRRFSSVSSDSCFQYILKCLSMNFIFGIHQTLLFHIRVYVLCRRNRHSLESVLSDLWITAKPAAYWKLFDARELDIAGTLPCLVPETEELHVIIDLLLQ